MASTRVRFRVFLRALGWWAAPTLRLWRLLAETWRRWNADQASLLSAAMAFYAACSLFPCCLVLIALLGTVLRHVSSAQDARKQLLDTAARNASPWLAEQLNAVLAEVERNATLGGPLGLILLLFASIGMFQQFDSMLDRIWGGAHSQAVGVWAAVRRALVDRLTAFIVLLGFGGLVVVVLLADLVLAAARPLVVPWPAGGYAWEAVRESFSVVCNSLLFGVLFKVLPRASVRWRHALAGGLLTALVWRIGQQILARFLISGFYSAYGVVGSFLAVLIWMYYSSAVLFFGAEFVRVLGRGRGRSRNAENLSGEEADDQPTSHREEATDANQQPE
ncbi:MAG TPA: YihY/virulence factor BrkB family protein [Pirellulales bacterium]|nr:YihY/virulence factor BrkB family protein [Pirellulales bacterium]